MRETTRYITVLFLICLVAGVFLSAVFAVTQPVIERTRQEEMNAAIKAVVPQAAKIEKESKQGLAYYKALDPAGGLLGYVFICEGKGYSSLIRSVVSTDPSGKILLIKVLEQNETPGIGTKITQNSFLESFQGKTFRDKIDTIGGATISSSAMIKSIKSVLEQILP